VVVHHTDDYGVAGVKHFYWCEGCALFHGMAILPTRQDDGCGWTFTGTLDRPTYSPAHLSLAGGHVCHSRIRAGRIEFCSDCTHRLRGQGAPAPGLAN